MADFIINDDTPLDVTHNSGFSRGCVPRNYSTHPAGYLPCAPEALDLPLIPRDQWVARIQDMQANNSRLSDIRRRSAPGGAPIPSLDQNGWEWCWAHSTTMAVILQRALMGEPYVRLSACMIASISNNYQNTGGWGAQSLDFAAKYGIASVSTWPEKSGDRANDTPAMRAEALKHLVTGQWADLSAAEYDRNFTEDQAMTLLLTRNPVVGDFNWWGHSICLLDPTITSSATASTLATKFSDLDLNDPQDLAAYAAAFGKRFINSWTDQWGDLGEGTLEGSKALLNGGVAPRLVLASAA